MSRSLPSRPIGLPDGRPLAVRAAIERFCPGERRRRSVDGGLTLVEMLVAMAVTLLMMAAIVTVFANISGSVTRRRATMEMSGTLRGVRELLAKDLAGATCPALPWRRPEANEGYLELIEGPSTDAYPTPWLYSSPNDTQTVNDSETGLGILEPTPDGEGGLTEPIGTVPGIDLGTSTLPGSTLRDSRLDDAGDEQRYGRVLGSEANLPRGVLTDGRGLGDADDTLMLTVRNEDELFTGRIPARTTAIQNVNVGHANVNATEAFRQWDAESAESPLAEVVWFALQNPVERSDTRTFAFGEPGYRTIYRRVLLILPDIDYGFFISGTQQRIPRGVVRVLPAGVTRDEPALALAALIAFQERYDLSVRIEWDPTIDPGATINDGGRWVIRANTLADLTKPENRFEHHGFVADPEALAPRPDNPVVGAPDRHFPFAAVSAGLHSATTPTPLEFVSDPELAGPAAANEPRFRAVFQSTALPGVGARAFAVAYEPSDTTPLDPNRRYLDQEGRTFRPLCFVTAEGDAPATARAVLNEDGQVVHVTRGLAPLGGDRRGEDVVLTDALAFDLRVFDPGAPLYGYYPGGYSVAGLGPDEVLRPGEPAWYVAAASADPPPDLTATGNPYSAYNDDLYVIESKQGAYVDLGYGWSPFQVSGANTGRIPVANRFVPLTPPQWRWNIARFGLDLRSLIPPQFDSYRLPLPPNPPTASFASDWYDGLITLGTQAPLPRTWLFRSYDTWSWHYEANGVNEDADLDELGRPMIDEGTNGVDDFDPTVSGALNLVEPTDTQRYGADDPLERETRPPFDSPLRGMQVKLRVYERDSRQIREATVRQAFVPN